MSVDPIILPLTSEVQGTEIPDPQTSLAPTAEVKRSTASKAKKNR
jgi:hypothetical protein